MRPDPPPPGPPDVEHELTGRTCPEPSQGLRDRILAAVSAERRTVPALPAGNPRKMVWQAAAVVVLALNLAMSVANGLRYQSLAARVAPPNGMAQRQPQRGPAPADVDDHLPPFAATALAQLRPAPDPAAIARRYLDYKEN
jgi:hypothetical protein